MAMLRVLQGRRLLRTNQRVPAGDRSALALMRRLRLTLLLSLVVIVIASAGFVVIESMTPLDAVYQTIITISSVGFTEVGGPFSTAGKLWMIAVIVCGMSVSLYALGAAVELLVGEQFSHLRQKQKMTSLIGRLDEHTIICGYGRIGRQLAVDFTESATPFVVVDSNAARTEMLTEANILFVEGDATLDETLLEAGVERARAIVCSLNTDADNVMTCVTARGLNPKIRIVARAALPEAEKKLRRAGADEVISPYVVGARTISLSLLRPAVSNLFEAVLLDRELQDGLVEVVVEPGGQLDGQTLESTALAHGEDVLPLALLRNARLQFYPLPDTVLLADDRLIIVLPTRFGSKR